MTISIIIPAFNEEKYLDICLQSILGHDNPDLLEVIVVDNNSKDRTAEIVKAYDHKKVRLIAEPTRGPNFARQTGYLQSKGEIIATVDADSKIPDHWFEEMQKAFKNPAIAGISGPYDYYDFPFLKRNFVFFLWKYLGLISYHFSGFVVYGGNFAGRRSALEKIGGFDPTIFFYGDDADTGRRLSKVGKVPFLPSFFIYSSARRLKAQGIFYICWIYGINFVSEALFGKPHTMLHKDFR